MEVPILKIPFSADDKATITSGVASILDSGALTMGKYTKAFEEAFCQLTGARFAVATSNCTTALEIIPRALGIHGKSVIVPTNTFLATALAVMHSGNRVVFADSDPATLCLDVHDLPGRLEPDTAAVILVHIGGVVTGAVEQIRAFCAKHKLYLIEDCAHAHGCTINGQQAGALGVAGAFSFFPTKVLVTGEGGMLTTNDESLYREALKIRNHGKDPSRGNRMSAFGHNYRLSEFTALLGVQQMSKASTLFAERQQIAAWYDQRLKNVEHVTPLKLPAGVTSTYYKYVAYLDPIMDRAAVKRALKEEYQVSLTGEVYSDLCHTELLWESFTLCGRPRRAEGKPCPDCPDGACERPFGAYPGAERISRHHVCLPLYPGLSQAQVDHVVESLARVLAREAEKQLGHVRTS